MWGSQEGRVKLKQEHGVLGGNTVQRELTGRSGYVLSRDREVRMSEACGGEV